MLTALLEISDDPKGSVLPDKKLIVVARTDNAMFGILHSRFHELWSLRMCSWLGVGNDPRYTPTTTFETFPQGLTPVDTAPQTPPGLPLSGEETGADLPLTRGDREGLRVIAASARNLDERRNNWLNPPERVDWVRTPEEEKAGFPLRPVPH